MGEGKREREKRDRGVENRRGGEEEEDRMRREGSIVRMEVIRNKCIFVSIIY